ncbi:hypothetical protein BGAL_0533g00090 [Botrytis galanthina]|uniref:Uncharacterized protein n=1 Tax=Botrytis galanthina TaxID=278940 RepID=A0A4S8QUA8_9HELO|nr:hypothetical protein BGAL_0533g00090 [Botrytis galanthina]
MSENFEQHFLPPHHTTTYDKSPSSYHESAPNTYDYYYPNSVSQGQWLYGRGSGQPTYSPLMPYHEQTKWQQTESPQRSVNSYSGYVRTSPYIISSDRQNMRNTFSSRRLTNELRHVKSDLDLSFRLNVDGEREQMKNHEADIFWIVVPAVYGKNWCEKFSSKQPFNFWNLRSGI